MIHLVEKKTSGRKSGIPSGKKSSESKPAASAKNTSKEKSTVKTKDKPEPATPVPSCPICKTGTIIKGKAAYGCSGYKTGCTFRINFEIEGKKLTEKQIFGLIRSGKTGEITGFTVNNKKVKGHLTLDGNQTPVLNISEEDTAVKTEEIKSLPTPAENSTLLCRKCGIGHMIRGNAAYGCSRYREGCRFIIPFEKLQKEFNTEVLTGDILDKVIRAN